MNIIFITYINRSGSTFLANIFTKYSEVLVCPEAEVLINLFLVNPSRLFNFQGNYKQKFLEIIKNDIKLKFWRLFDSDLTKLESAVTCFEAFVIILELYKQKVKPEANTLVFKGVKLINLIDKMLFADQVNFNIHLISIIRDPRGVYNSQKVTIGTNNKPLSNNPVQTSVEWKQFAHSSDSLKDNNKFHYLKYEDLIINTEDTISNLLNAMNIRFTKSGSEGDLFGRLPGNMKHMHSNILKEADISLIYKWKKKLSNEEILIIEKKTKNMLLKNNYELTFGKINSIKYIFISIYYYTDYYLKTIYKKLINLLLIEKY